MSHPGAKLEEEPGSCLKCKVFQLTGFNHASSGDVEEVYEHWPSLSVCLSLSLITLTGFGPVHKTSDPDEFWNILNTISPLAGGDEPEMCLSALQVLPMWPLLMLAQYYSLNVNMDLRNHRDKRNIFSTFLFSLLQISLMSDVQERDWTISKSHGGRGKAWIQKPLSLHLRPWEQNECKVAATFESPTERESTHRLLVCFECASNSRSWYVKRKTFSLWFLEMKYQLYIMMVLCSSYVCSLRELVAPVVLLDV